MANNLIPIEANLTDLAQQINQEHEQAQAAMRSSLAHALKCGELLTQAKNQVKHGEWLPWLAENCNMPERTAQAYMRIAHNWPELEKSATIADLTFSGALKLLAAPNDIPAPDSESFEAWTVKAERILSEGNNLAELTKIAHEGLAWQNSWAEYKIKYQRKLGETLQKLQTETGGRSLQECEMQISQGLLRAVQAARDLGKLRENNKAAFDDYYRSKTGFDRFDLIDSAMQYNPSWATFTEDEPIITRDPDNSETRELGGLAFQLLGAFDACEL